MNSTTTPVPAKAEDVWIITGVLSSAMLLLIILVLMLMWHVKKLNTRVTYMAPEDGDHAFRAPTIIPNEELGKRGFSQYGGSPINSPAPTGYNTPDYSVVGRPISVYTAPQTPYTAPQTPNKF